MILGGKWEREKPGEKGMSKTCRHQPRKTGSERSQKQSTTYVNDSEVGATNVEEGGRREQGHDVVQPGVGNLPAGRLIVHDEAGLVAVCHAVDRGQAVGAPREIHLEGGKIRWGKESK